MAVAMESVTNDEQRRSEATSDVPHLRGRVHGTVAVGDVVGRMKYQLYQGDCLEIMPSLPSGNIDLTVTSPPYDNLREYGPDFDSGAFNWQGVIKELHRVTKPGGVVVWVVADATINGSETGTSFRQALWAMECGFNVETMIYQQSGTGAKGSNYYYWQAFEFMFVWAKGQPKTSNRIADKQNAKHGAISGHVNKVSRMGTRRERGLRVVPKFSVRPNIWRYAMGKSIGDTGTHPAPFPEALARDHILSWSNPGDIVFDPMLGSGTTGKMAMLTGRQFIGCELDDSYFATAQRRIEDAARQARGEFRTYTDDSNHTDLPLFAEALS